MPAHVDTILDFTDLLDEFDFAEAMKGLRIQTYDEYLRVHFALRTGRNFPEPTPAGPQMTANAYVNSGRWIWQCMDCLGGVLLERGVSMSFCPDCGNGHEWTAIVWPDNVGEIEAELLLQPGFRTRAPIRQWLPDWTMEYLQQRTIRAGELRAAGVNPIVKLSIGATRTWAVGETLTAGNMNTFISHVLADLAGRDGPIEFENSIEVADGSGKYLRIPRMTGSARGTTTATNGFLIYDTTDDEYYGVRDGVWGRLAAARRSVVTSTGTATLNLTTEDDRKVFVVSTATGLRTVNLPDLAANDVGKVYTLIKDGAANTITIDPHGGDSINGGSAFILREDNESFTFVSVGTGAWATLSHYIPSARRFRALSQGAYDGLTVKDSHTIYLVPE